ncbi:MAG: hemolysin III family protein [Ginsengibacter sp.]
MPARTQTILEEKLNSLTHGFGLILSIIFVATLFEKVWQKGDQEMWWGVSIFSFGMLAVYLSSTIYHSLRHAGFKRIANIVDHISIFFLIGGTYAPIILRYVPNKTAAIFLAIQWAIIFAGVILKIFYTGRYEWLSVSLYVTLGWMLIFVIKPIIATMPAEVFYWILAGGACYTLGVIFYVLEHRKHAHNIWHCFVLAGTISHFIAVYETIDVNVVF